MVVILENVIFVHTSRIISNIEISESLD